jgi:hypothetical protein
MMDEVEQGRSLFLILNRLAHSITKKKLEAYLVGPQVVRCTCKPRKVRGPPVHPDALNTALLGRYVRPDALKHSITVAFMAQQQHPVNLY